ncbi:MAG: hypothetical protein JWM25_676, partial [Thermoleophilia bacterium]|nr:hypothetical protein [Thermoleophilia bacterium]
MTDARSRTNHVAHGSDPWWSTDTGTVELEGALDVAAPSRRSGVATRPARRGVLPRILHLL